MTMWTDEESMHSHNRVEVKVAAAVARKREATGKEDCH